ncbi:MAG: recombination protein RecR [Candidatus Sungbacteria bacterium]|uniref:Recombination protein RecR n=1 Tax=Candidatus Sungiibacteriota bacterium TaxID=2750080 RepID=A0A933DT32_9BACT|nr:recombination protein RecR [Candidatus Sungbacteria bacterium]
MFSKPIQNLVEFFLKFPGVGPKQATRFVFYLLREEPGRVSALADAIARLHDEVKLCRQCYKTFDMNPAGSGSANGGLCELCRNPRRNVRQVLVVEKEVDLENVERTRKYDGLYHVLGGTVSPLDSSAPTKLHLKEFFERIQRLAQEDGPIEVILATNPTAEGDATSLYLERVLAPLKNQYPVLTVSRLGRGLTTGSELEYSDDITIANAIQNRK